MLSRMQARGSTPGLERRSWKSRAEEPVGRGPRGGGVRGAGLTPDLLPSAVPLEGPSHAEALSCPRPLPGNLAPGPPAASVAMVTPAQGSPPGPQMLGLISLSASGSGDDGLSEQGWGTSEARLQGIPVWQVPSWVLGPGDRREWALLLPGKWCGWRKGLCGKWRES